MKKRWLIGGLTAALVAGVGGAAGWPPAVFSRSKPDEPEIPLEFVANELVRPVPAPIA